MVGFRNIAVHDYQNLNLEIVRSILERNFGDFRRSVVCRSCRSNFERFEPQPSLRTQNLEPFA
jgi:uncharacterized protein YutE (UPF0331/DUF86 family)